LAGPRGQHGTKRDGNDSFPEFHIVPLYGH
jgi:hypothetical protein